MVREDKIRVTGMSCSNCEFRIEKEVRKIKGVVKVKADFQKETAIVKYDNSKTTLVSIKEVIQKAGYKVEDTLSNKKADKGKIRIKKSDLRFIGAVICLLGVYGIIDSTVGFNFIPSISQNMGYGMLFIAGLFTSLHCLAMCGGINISQSIMIKDVDNRSVADKLIPGMVYNLGRIVSYTTIGGIVGGIGSVLTLSGRFKGLVAIISGVLMLLMGLNMAGIKVKYIRLDFLNKSIANKVFNGSKKSSRFYVGLLNGLMPCGPLQAMQLYALGTGSIITGALSMLVFGIGTFPLLTIFSLISATIDKKFTSTMVKASSALIIVLSTVMVTNGLAVSGVVIGFNKSGSSNNAILEDGKQVVKSSFSSGKYEKIKLKKDTPVKWVIHMEDKDINGCNETIVIPEYNIEKTLVKGDNIVEFTPNKTGTFGYSCWMGMIRSTIIVE